MSSPRLAFPFCYLNARFGKLFLCLLFTSSSVFWGASSLLALSLGDPALRNLEHHAHSNHLFETNKPLSLPSEQNQTTSSNLLLQVGWESAYVCEGLKAFESGGIFIACTEAHVEGFLFSFWQGQSDTHQLSESKLLLGYEYTFGQDFTFTPSYEYARTSPDNVKTHTPALSLSYALNDTYSLGVTTQWDAKKSHGRAYYDLSLEGSWNLTEKLSLSLSLLYAYNDGFLGEDLPHGSNSLDYSLLFNYQCDKSWCLVLSLNYSQALTSLNHGSLRDEETGVETTLGKLFWVGTYVHYQF